MRGVLCSACLKEKGRHFHCNNRKQKHFVWLVFFPSSTFVFCFKERWFYVLKEKLHLMINRMMDVKDHLFEQIINQHLYMIGFFQ